MFLTADYSAGPSDIAGRFPTLLRLKKIMEDSGRRFKPVFAGLHQVQRFHDSANTPVAHGGSDILIGPLRPTEVRKLIVEPLRVIGYEFSGNELVWRVAALTNYQASLVQIFCEALVNHLRDRRLSRTGGRVIVTSDDIDAVYGSGEVRKLIAQRFRWTINLDNRYRVIAIVAALLSSESVVFEPQELHEYCEAYWPEAFSGQTMKRAEFVRYLDELVGLGVLRRSGHRYGLRSPNVIPLLGPRHQLDQELNEASVHLELPYEYNPMMSRAPMPRASRAGLPRSPLTDSDVATLVGVRPDRGPAPARVATLGNGHSVAVVTGTEALEISRVPDAVMHAAQLRGAKAEQVVCEDLERALADYRKQKMLLVVRCAGHAVQHDLSDVTAAVAAQRAVRAVLVMEPDTHRLSDGLSVLMIWLRRWSEEALRAWHDFPFDHPPDRKRLHRLTSGWPGLVESAVELVAQGRSTEDVLDQLTNPFPDAEQAREFLRKAGVSCVSEPVTTWARYCTDPDAESGFGKVQPVSPADLGAILDDDPAALLDRLKSLDAVYLTSAGWMLDSVIAVAALAAGE